VATPRGWLSKRWRSPSLSSSSVAVGFQWLLRLQVGVVYTFAGLAKLSSDWLLHHQPLRIWLGSHTDMPILGVVFRQLWAAPVMSWAGFLFDTTIVWWLLYRRTRALAYVALLVFHALTSALFPIGMFPVIMSTAALMFFSPSWPRAALSALLRASRALGAPATRLHQIIQTPRLGSGRPAPRPVHRVVLAAGLLYAVVQVALPLRHLAYAGDVSWHEQGMRFSWRVMVREKNGSIELIARDTTTGQTRIVMPRRFLTREQESEMWGQPDLILQLAHHVARTLQRDTGHRFEVRADAKVSLNGRKAHRLIDPEVDLARVDDGWAQASWIMPSPSEPPPHLRPVQRVSVAGQADPSRLNPPPWPGPLGRPSGKNPTIAALSPRPTSG